MLIGKTQLQNSPATMARHPTPKSPVIRSSSERFLSVSQRPAKMPSMAVAIAGSVENGPSGSHVFVETQIDRKSTRLNSSHANISYAVFCLKKKNKKTNAPRAD